MQPPREPPGTARPPAPTELIAGLRRLLLAWSALLVVVGLVYAFVGRGWSWVAIATGVLTLVLALRARPGDSWRALALRALCLVALGMTAAGVVLRADVWISSGLLGVLVVAVGAIAVARDAHG